MPQLGNTVEECILTRWVRKAGDHVAAGDVVAEIETDKTTFEVTAPVDGTILATLAEEGALVPVFTNIFVIGQPGEQVEQYRPAAAASEPRAAQSPTVAPGETPPQPAIAVAEPAAVTGSAAAAYSPRASRLAAALGFQSRLVSGSGPGGRILERDVRHEHETAGQAPARRVPKPQPAPPGGSALRATIARRMRESLASTAQYTLHTTANATGLIALRARAKDSASAAVSDVTINELVTFCTIQALLGMPELNAEFVDSRIVSHADVHLAFAVDTPRGLLAPVVRDAHTLSIGELTRRMKSLTQRARAGTLAADDLHGGTFTISNLGGLGVECFTPVINPPQVAILGVDAVVLRPVRRPGPREPLRLRETSARRAAAFADGIDFVDTIGLSLTCDHQVIDGAPGARFLQLLRTKIEQVESICEF